ncbi:AMP-binding protein [Streptomyces sp. NPDC050560]|uniref:AMP-binding protein n=1 Tax=Streptomyces sp. NPDC050560 TaxID=3365630 RepID=UPI0037B1D3B5
MNAESPPDAATTVWEGPTGDTAAAHRASGPHGRRRCALLARARPDDVWDSTHLVVDLTGPLDVPLLRRALDLAVTAHAEAPAGSADTAGRGPVAFDVADRAGPHTAPTPTPTPAPAPAPAPEETWAWAREALSRPLPPLDGPPVRATLLRVGAAEHVLVLVCRRSFADVRSAGLLFEALSAGYAALAGGEEPTAAPVRRPPDRAAHDAAPGHWADRLRRTPRGSIPPPDRPGPAGPTHEERRSLPLDGATVAALAARFADVAPLPVVLLAVFVRSLTRFTGEDETAVALPVSGRCPDDRGRVGPFENAVVVRADPLRSLAFREFLGVQYEEVRAAVAHRHIPVDALVAARAPESYADRAPLAGVTFDVGSDMPPARDAAGLRMVVRDIARPLAECPLAVRVLPDGADFRVEVRYPGELYSPGFVDTFLSAYLTLLARTAGRPGPGPLEPPRQDAAAAHLRRPRSRYPQVVDLFREAAADAPHTAAVVRGDRSWSYGALAERACEVAGTLRALDVRPGEVVAVRTADRGFSLYATLLGVWQAGGIPVLVDAALSAGESAARLTVSRAQTLLVVGGPPSARDLDAAGEAVDNVVVHSADAGLAVLRRGRGPDRSFAEPSAAYINFTSGTTGAPKALLGRHDSLSHFVLWQRDAFGFAPGDRCAQLTSLFTDGVLRDIVTPLISGATLYVPPPPLEPTGAAVLGWLRDAAIASVHTMPSLSSRWLREAGRVGRLPALRRLFFSGEPLNSGLTRPWHRLAPDAHLVNLYGTSECTMIQAFHRVDHGCDDLVHPAGTGMPGAGLLLSAPDGSPCGTGEVGRVSIRTAHPTHGYLGGSGPGAVCSPFHGSAHDAVFSTDDLARRRADGTLEVLGRVTDGAKDPSTAAGSARLNALLSRQPGVRASAVVSTPRPGGPPRTVAFLVPEDGHGGAAGEVRRALRAHLPAAALPAHILELDELPVTAVGKLDRARLRDVFAAHQARNGFRADAGPVEKAVATAWTAALDTAEPRADDHFFERGGTPDDAVGLAAGLRAGLALPLPDDAVFTAPVLGEFVQTVRELARVNGALL